jgi:OmpA-OmpF porin, OOP family
MQRGVVLSIAVLAFGLFCFFCIRTNAPMIQQDVSARALSLLGANHIPGGGLRVDGRDVLLSGPAGSVQVSEATQNLVRSDPSVWSVSVHITDSAADARTVTPSATAETQGKLDSLLEQDVVEFNTASADLTAHGRSVLDQVATLLAASPAAFCEIQGHTDSQGNADANRDLSYRRAIETKNYLVNKGIAPDRLTTKGLGDAQPIASNETAEGRRKNRRINFVLKEKL